MSIAEQALSVKGQVSVEEWQTRVDLAACYRMIAMYGWDDLIFTHISARVPGADEHFLINAYGLLFEEMTASSLVKVDLDAGSSSRHRISLIRPDLRFTAPCMRRARMPVVSCIRTPKQAWRCRHRPAGYCPFPRFHYFPSPR